MTSNTITIRRATLADMPTYHRFVRELAIFEKAPEAHTATIADYEKDFSEGIFQGQVAEDEHGTILGITLYYMAYSTWKGRMMYLDDFVVTEASRGKGIGKMLFDALLQECKQRECKMLKFQVLRWNEPAIEFYKKYAATFDDEWLDVKLYF